MVQDRSRNCLPAQQTHTLQMRSPILVIALIPWHRSTLSWKSLQKRPRHLPTDVLQLGCDHVGPLCPETKAEATSEASLHTTHVAALGDAAAGLTSIGGNLFSTFSLKFEQLHCPRAITGLGKRMIAEMMLHMGPCANGLKTQPYGNRFNMFGRNQC